MDIENEKLEYYPDKKMIYIVILFSIIFLLPLFVFLVYFGIQKDWATFRVVMTFFVIIILILVPLIILSRKRIIFTKEAVYIQLCPMSKLKEYRYDTYLFPYYYRTYRKELFLVLSKHKLEKNKVKRVVTVGRNFELFFYDSCVLIFIDEDNKGINSIKDYISQHVQNVHKIENMDYWEW